MTNFLLSSWNNKSIESIAINHQNTILFLNGKSSLFFFVKIGKSP